MTLFSENYRLDHAARVQLQIYRLFFHSKATQVPDKEIHEWLLRIEIYQEYMLLSLVLEVIIIFIGFNGICISFHFMITLLLRRIKVERKDKLYIKSSCVLLFNSLKETK